MLIPHDARFAVLIAGTVLLAIAVVGAVAAAARKNSRRAGHIQRAVAAVVGAALIVWAGALWPRVAREAPAAPAAAGTTAAASSGAAVSTAHAVAHPDLVFLADSVFDACVAPSRPAAAPDGAKATRRQMQTSQAAARAFDAATDAYQRCLNTAENNFVRQYGRGMDQSNLQAVDAQHTRMNNAAVDVDQSVADQFNKQLRIFNARTGS